MRQFLDHLEDRNYQKRKVGIIENGSWAPSAGKYIKNMLQQIKDIDIIEPIVTIKSTMKLEDINTMEKLAEELLK